MTKKVLVFALTIALAATLVGGATMAWFTDSDASGPAEFTAGTVMIEANSSVVKSQNFDPSQAVYVYGVEADTGDLYEIDVATGESNMIFDTPIVELAPTDSTSPNGLAFDRDNGRLYFSIRQGRNTDLYFYDFGERDLVRSGTVENTVIYGAAYGEGYYWYVNDGTDDLYRIRFDAAGKYASRELVKANISGGATWYLGDVELDYVDGSIYVNAGGFFKYDPTTEDCTEIMSNCDRMQIAYGSDGNLYGHSTNTKKWYEVNLTEPSVKETSWNPGESFNDLASGYISVWNPGDTDKVKYQVHNKGTKKSYVRAEISGHWTEFDEDAGQWVDWDAPDNVVTISPCANTGWEQHGSHIYYNDVLGPGDTVDLAVEVHLDGPGTGNEFQGKRYVLTATFDAIQASNGASQEVWEWSPGN